MTPRETRADAESYAKRLSYQYNDEVAEFMCSPEWTGEGLEPAFHKGGPWQYTYPDGTIGAFNISKLVDAKAALRKQLGRSRLPKGITWEIYK